ncbi:DinB family protein [Bacillus solimangrovi]|uniref:DinB-like domain-containing protein n=1 Tax=Bacillus solimangrovi TaxID=1305675 RepID=A0A1E5LIY2_9BACI|nr:DinB family protein [Bacillus solimangrovi]OEH94049.1 hypothetical protein BFG57_10410 [Bacillus solimangrovi]
MSVYTVSFGHNAMLNVLMKAREDQLDVIPEGFNNSIRWNAGHVLVITDAVLSLDNTYKSVVPESYKEYFMKGTSPREWEGEPPSVEEISEFITKQLKTIQETFVGREDEELERPFELLGASFTKVKDILGFICFHTGMHFNITLNYLRIVK